MTAVKIDSGLAAIKAANSERGQRGLVLGLLENVRGVGISELGKIQKKDKKRSKMQEAFMAVDEAPKVDVGAGSPDLGGVAELFG